MNEAQILLSQARSHLRVVRALLFAAADEIIETTQDMFDEAVYNDVNAMRDTLDACMRDLNNHLAPHEPR